MGCCYGNTKTFEQWETAQMNLEDEIIRLSGFQTNEYEREFTIIQMDGAPFKVRTFYFDRNDKSKETLVLTHGNMAQAISYQRLIKLLSQKYRIVAFDLMNLGLNTRSTSKAPHQSPETAEQWIIDFVTQTINGLDIPDKFYMAAHSWGAYLTMMYASIRPDRIQSIFLMSPAGTHSYNPETYDQYSYVSMRDATRMDTKSEVDDHMRLIETKQHPFSQLNKYPQCIKMFILKLIANSAEKFMRLGNYTEQQIQVFCQYQKQMLERPGEGDITMFIPFKYPCTLIHSMNKADRMNNSKCTFPIGMAFGTCDFFSSDNGAEEILINARQHNGNRINLFKVQNGTHCFPYEQPEETAKLIIGHFDGSIINRWEPTIYASGVLKKSTKKNSNNSFLLKSNSEMMIQ